MTSATRAVDEEEGGGGGGGGAAVPSHSLPFAASTCSLFRSMTQTDASDRFYNAYKSPPPSNITRHTRCNASVVDGT